MLHGLKIRIDNIAKWDSSVMKMLGTIEIIFGIMLVIPSLIAIYFNEEPSIFIYPIPILLILGGFQYLLFRSKDTMRPANGMMMMFIAWWIAFVVSAIPFFLHGFSFVDSLFEGVSGFTTTGATVIGHIDSLPMSLIFWRSFSQWTGGIAVVLIFLFLIPMMGIGGRAFVNSELTGYQSYNFSMRLKSAAKNFVSIYVLLSAVEMLLLILCGTDVFEAVTLTFSTVSTGGAMISGRSMADFSMIVQAIVLVFMFLGGTNFYLHFRTIYKKDISAYRKSQEFIWTVIWFMSAAAIIALLIVMNSAGTQEIDLGYVGETVWNSIFTVVSVGTTTGYSVTDQTAWPVAASVILWMLMLFGSMSGSTSGGIKIYRLLILKSYITNGIHRMFHPRSVTDVRLDGHSVENETVVSAIVVIMLFILTLVLSIIFISVAEPGMALDNIIDLALSAVTNGGKDAGVAYHELGDITKIFLMLIMWVGRLEVVMVLLLFTKTFRHDLISGMRSERNGRTERKRL